MCGLTGSSLTQPSPRLSVGNDCVTLSACVRDLGDYVDSDATKKTRISRTAPVCFAVLRQIRRIRRSLSQQVLRSLVFSLVLTCCDYGNATLTGSLSTQLNRLQTATVVDKYRCTTCMFGTEVRANHAAAPRPPLVTAASADRVQTCHSGLPLPT